MKGDEADDCKAPASGAAAGLPAEPVPMSAWERQVMSAEEGAPRERVLRIGEDRAFWPYVIVGVNGYILVGQVLACILLAIFQSDSRPGYFDGLDLPDTLWVYYALSIAACALGLAAGIALLLPLSDGTTRGLCASNAVIAALPLVLTPLVVYGCIDYSQSDFGERHEWTVIVLAIWVVYTTCVNAVWGFAGLLAFRLRDHFAEGFVPEPFVVPTPPDRALPDPDADATASA
eukprot:TRINITY_DN13717_c0_g1_i1.p1 TRINITY_DN13717_c0_g1~~TRINITY_DN13717_c0_g1_i1.p1  ORF type:complete len:232 (+),score=43.02 TRINITY_DN13717_c0_g1_i1:121-816(+)